MAEVLSTYAPVILVDFELDATHRFATRDFHDSHRNPYRGTLKDFPSISKELSDLYHGVEQTSVVTLRFANEREEGSEFFTSLQDFLGYTETDPNGRIGVAANTITFTGLSEDEDAWVYRDMGANYFSRNFRIHFEVEITASDASTEQGIVILANAVKSYHNIDSDNESYLGVVLYRDGGVNYQIHLDECDSGARTSDSYTCATGTRYYLVMERKEEVGTYGTLYCYIYSDVDHSTLLDTLSVTLSTSKKDFRYIYGLNAHNDGVGANVMSGVVANLYLYKEHTWDQLANVEELREQWVAIQRHDPTNTGQLITQSGDHLTTQSGQRFRVYQFEQSLEYRGKVINYRLGPIVEVAIEMRDDWILDTLLPRHVVTTDEFTATALDLGEPVNICFGKCRNIPLRNIQNNTGTDQYDYLAGYGPIQGLWVDHANGLGVKYGNGSLVDTTDYTFYDGSQATPYSGYAFIRFTAEQRDFSGQMINFTADVYGLEMGGVSMQRNFATVIENLLYDAVWGLGDNIDTTFFRAAATALSGIGNMYCDGGITEQRQARDFLNDLLFPARASIERAADGEWEIEIDGAGSSVLSLGENDGYYNNAEIGDVSITPSSEALKTVTVQYSLNSADKDVPFKESSINVHTFGVDRTYTLPFVLEDDTAELILSYLKNRSLYSDRRVPVFVGMEGRDLSRGDIVTLSKPDRQISAVDFKIEGITKGGIGFEMECREYNTSIHGVESVTPPTGPTASEITVEGPRTWVGPIQLGDGINQPGTITLNVAPGQGDIYIGAGKTDFTNAVNGFIIGIDDSDSDKVKMYLGDATENMYWDGSNLFLTGTITADAGAIGGWDIVSGYIYSLAGGTPTVAPEDGVVLASGNPALIVYEDTAKRLEVGYLSAGVYGIKGYDTGGANVTFEISDTQMLIAGWTISQTTLANSTDIILDASNKKISIKDATYGNDGIQLDYNAGNPRAYIGDGANQYFNFDGTQISWKTPNTKLSTAGKLTTVSADIGGWNIVTGYIYNLRAGTPTVNPEDGIVLASGDEALIVYEDTVERVRVGYIQAGVYGIVAYTTAGPANKIFEISDTQQMMAGWLFDTTSIADNVTAANAKIYIDSTNTLIRCGPTTGDYLTLDGANLRLRSSNYVTGMAGAGFTLEPDLLEVGNIACRGIIRTAVFQKDIISAVGGTIAISKGSDVLATDMSQLDAATLTIEGNETFAANDIIRIKDDTDDEWILVTNVAGAPTYVITRDQAGAYVADNNPAWKKGATAINYGPANAGFILLASTPYIQMATHAGAPWVAMTTRMWIGNLNGVYGYGADVYGIAMGAYSAADYITIENTNGIRFLDAGDVVRAQLNGGIWTLGVTTAEHVKITATSIELKDGATVYTELSGGTLILGDIANEHVRVSAAEIELKNGATIYGSFAATTTIGETGNEHISITNTKVEIKDGATVYTRLEAGKLSLGLGGAIDVAIYIKDATYGNDGIQLEYNAGSPRIYVGDGANAYFQFDGTKIQWKGANTELDASGNLTCIGGSIGGFYIGANDIWGGNAAIGNVATTIVLGNLDGTSKIALGPTADSITVGGAALGFIADGTGKFYGGDGANDFIKFDGTNVSMSMALANGLTVRSGGDILIKQGGDIMMEGGAAGNPSLIRFRDEAIPGEIRFEQSANPANYWSVHKTAGGGDNLIIERFNITAQLYIKSYTYIEQTNATGAIAVLSLDQDDISKGFINFIGSDRGNLAGLAIQASVRVERNGTVYRIPLYADG